MAMRITTALLCDFAQVRDGLLFVSSGAVTRLFRHDLPAPLGVMVAVVIDVPLEDAGAPHTLRVQVVNRHNNELAGLTSTFEVGNDGVFPHEVQQVPLVLSVTGVTARSWGTHQVRLWLDEEPAERLTFYLVPSPTASGASVPILEPDDLEAVSGSRAAWDLSAQFPASAGLPAGTAIVVPVGIVALAGSRLIRAAGGRTRAGVGEARRRRRWPRSAPARRERQPLVAIGSSPTAGAAGSAGRDVRRRDRSPGRR